MKIKKYLGEYGMEKDDRSIDVGFSSNFDPEK